MKEYFILSAKLFLISFLFSSCSKSDDNSGSPSGSSGNDFIASISQAWKDSLNANRTFFFAVPDSAGRFTGNENDGLGNINSLSGKTKNFDISFTIIRSQTITNYVDYTGKLTDTTAHQMRMVVYSKKDTLYLRQP